MRSEKKCWIIESESVYCLSFTPNGVGRYILIPTPVYLEEWDKKTVRYAIKQVISALFILAVCFPVSMVIGVGLNSTFAEALKNSGITTVQMGSFAPFLMWILFFLSIAVFLWFPILLAVSVVKETAKFKTKGIKTSPFWWGLGMMLPTVIIVFPLYFIKTRILWQREQGKEVVALSSTSTKSHKKKGVLVTFVVLLVFLPFLTKVTIEKMARSNRAFAISVVNNYFKYSSCRSGGCNELRPLPHVLQGKKIVFNQTTNIEFDPFHRHEDFSDLDVLGFLNTNSWKFEENFVNPTLGKRGNLGDREYKIVRAVYHHNCALCIDSSDYAYVVLEDSKGNRFESFLDDTDATVVPSRNIPWDNQVPFELGRNGELGTLVDSN